MLRKELFAVAIAWLLVTSIVPGQDSITLVPTEAPTASQLTVLPAFDLWTGHEVSQSLISPLKGNWIVRSIQRDGIVNPAQVGQMIGDVISFESVGDRFDMG